MELELIEHQLSVHEVRLYGRIDSMTTPALKQSFKAMTRNQQCNVILDLRDVTFLDSAGLGLLVSVLHAVRACVLHAVRACGGSMCCLILPGSPVESIFAMVRFKDVFTIYNTPEEAFQHFHF